ncbi:hypothetical protein HHK36_022751 [Tetracentron sinense]|uniref:DWNN domain-containing protein n=1 Tax=Tetracentron sinense TaxID=13715 RepID=A0A834YNE9_TETSI|nr:hypothetical protein HHK36_022751 [Tetracentron sinense]
MAVYYKFKSAKDYDSIPIDGHFISVANLKERIFEVKHLGKGTDFDLMVSNAQTNEEYLDEAMLIPKNTSVLVRRVPGRPRMTIVTEQDEQVVENKVEDAQPAKISLPGADLPVTTPEDSEWDEFGNDLYAIPEALPVQSSYHPLQDAPPPNKADEDSKIKALIDTPAFDWQRQTQDGFCSGRGFGRGMGGRMMGGRGFVRGGGLERKTPPQGYTCHRCKVPGHFIQHCPTNGDANYDIKRVKPPTGIPRSMLMATPDGFYALPSGAVAVLKPNEAAFEKEMEGLSSIRSVGDIPPELRCPLCKEVMKDAVLTSKCCFSSFCDKCIRDQIISKSMCVCGVTNILADDLLPNKTLRDTITRVLESNNSSADNAGSISQFQEMESSRCPQPKVLSPTLSVVSNGEKMPSHCNDLTTNEKEIANEGKAAFVNVSQQSLDEGWTAKNADTSEATLQLMSLKEPTSQGSVPLVEEEVQQKLAAGEPGKKKKKKKASMHANATEMQWTPSQDVAAENYMMPFAPSAYNNPYWTGPFRGQGYMMPVPPQRNFSEFGMGSHAAPPVMSREEFEARKADLRMKREIEQRGERHSLCSNVAKTSVVFNTTEADVAGVSLVFSTSDFMQGVLKNQDFGREVSNNGDVSSVKSKPRGASAYQGRPEKASSPYRVGRELEPVRAGKRTSVTASAVEADREQKSNVFSRISFPEEGGSKKRKILSPETNGYKDYERPGAAASSNHRPSTKNGYRDDGKQAFKMVAVSRSSGRKSAGDNDSSDDDRHFKRRPSRYEPSPAPVEWEEDGRASRGSRERERGRGDHYHR